MYTTENINQVVQAADFGDIRLNKRMGILLNKLSNNTDKSIPCTFKNRSQMKAAYNFLDNEKITPDKILQAQLNSQFVEQLKEHSTVLALHDTTELDFTGKRAQNDVGCLNYKNQKGLYLHNTLMVSSSGVPLSVFAQYYWSREEHTLSKSRTRKYLKIDQKESYRWVKGFENVQDYFNQYPDVTAINICDREGDIHELLQAKQTPNCHYIIRSCNNRKLVDSEQRLWQQVGQSPEQGQYPLLITDQITKQSRTATISVRYKLSVIIQPSYRKDKQTLQPVIVNIIEALEQNPPQGVKPVDWKLLTTLKIETLTDAMVILKYYSYRWRIESFHYVLKSGCHIEKLQLEQAHNLKNAITLYSLIACQILRWMHLSRERPTTDLEQSGYSKQDALMLHSYLQQSHQVKVEIKNSQEPTLQEFVKMIGILGGFKDWKKQPYPGVKALWHGFREFEIICSSFKAFKNITYG